MQSRCRARAQKRFLPAVTAGNGEASSARTRLCALSPGAATRHYSSPSCWDCWPIRKPVEVFKLFLS